jgi:hypothetical protein
MSCVCASEQTGFGSADIVVGVIQLMLIIIVLCLMGRL